MSVVAAAEKLSCGSLGITENDIKSVDIKPLHSHLKAEDL
jgi:hypothetical protein